jgi:hypothetical protein
MISTRTRSPSPPQHRGPRHHATGAGGGGGVAIAGEGGAPDRAVLHRGRPRARLRAARDVPPPLPLDAAQPARCAAADAAAAAAADAADAAADAVLSALWICTVRVSRRCVSTPCIHSGHPSHLRARACCIVARVC